MPDRKGFPWLRKWRGYNERLRLSAGPLRTDHCRALRSMMRSGDLRESIKLSTRRALGIANLGITRDPPMARLARALQTHGFTNVMDVGANIGQFAALLRWSGYHGDIYSFEPLQAEYNRLRRRARRDPKWHALHCALGETAGETVMNVSENSYSSSILSITEAHVMAAPRSRVVGTQRVPMSTVNDFAREYSLSLPSTFLKVDTQGYETQVLNGASDVLANIGGVQLELSMVPLYEGQELFDSICSRLAGVGLEIYALEPGIADERGRMLQCDALFLRGG